MEPEGGRSPDTPERPQVVMWVSVKSGANDPFAFLQQRWTQPAWCQQWVVERAPESS